MNDEKALEGVPPQPPALGGHSKTQSISSSTASANATPDIASTSAADKEDVYKKQQERMTALELEVRQLKSIKAEMVNMLQEKDEIQRLVKEDEAEREAQLAKEEAVIVENESLKAHIEVLTEKLDE